MRKDLNLWYHGGMSAAVAAILEGMPEPSDLRLHQAGSWVQLHIMTVSTVSTVSTGSLGVLSPPSAIQPNSTI